MIDKICLLTHIHQCGLQCSLSCNTSTTKQIIVPVLTLLNTLIEEVFISFQLHMYTEWNLGDINASVIDYENSRTCCLHAEPLNFGWQQDMQYTVRAVRKPIRFDKKAKEKSCRFSKHHNSKDLLEKNRYGSKIVIQKGTRWAERYSCLVFYK